MIKNISKICSTCKKNKDLCDFYNDNSRNDGKQRHCKKCSVERHRKYVDKNKEKIYKYSREYKNDNSERLSLWGREYRKKNKEELVEYYKIYHNSYAEFSIYNNKLTIEESPIKDEDGRLLVKCAKCGMYFIPRVVDVKNRIKGLRNSNGGENRLYCSEKCKQECDIFGAQTTPKSLRSKTKMSRCHQSLNKQQLIELQLDEYDYNFCEKCGNKFNRKDLIIHHNLMVSKNYKEADNMSHQILVCKECHKHEGC